jgi:dGTPase
LYDEIPSPTRTEFQRDRDRIIHSTGFRRLQGKTQVFLPDEGDHYRTRLTHTIEVSQIARALARALRLDEDLAEALALAHDLGHPPFGHAGERALDLAMGGHGGFDHNAQSLRVVTLLERRYPRFDGLNLTWEALEGLVKHNGPLTDRSGMARSGNDLPFAIADCDRLFDLWLWSYPSLEAQAAAIADDIAYDAHDIDDGLRAGLLDLDGLATVELVARILGEIDRHYPKLVPERRAYELVRRLITAMIEDVITESLARLESLSPASADDVRNASAAIVGLSEAMTEADREIKKYLTDHVYRHRRVMDVMDRAETVVERLFQRYWQDPSALPPDWRLAADAGDDDRARRIADFLAGMTDRYALAEYQRLFGIEADLG